MLPLLSKARIMAKNIFGVFFLCFLSTHIHSQDGIDKPALDSLLKKAELTQTDGLVIYYKGKLYGEYYFGKEPKQIEAMSSTKSIVNFAIGKLITDGLIPSVDQHVYETYPEWKQGMKKDITIRQLMNHTSGMQNFPNTNIEIYPSPDFVKLALAAEITDTPGIKFSYNNKAVNLLGGIVKTLTRKRIDNYLYEKIFKPLDIEDFSWTADDDGNPHCMSGLHILPKDMAKLGQLFLNKGEWNGKQLISKEWFTETGKPNKLSPNCGLLWWISYDTTLCIIDDQQLSDLKKIGFDNKILEKLKAMKGTYPVEEYNQLFGEKIASTTKDWTTKYVPLLLANGMAVSRKEFKNINCYYTDGFLGNYMAVYPKKNLIVVRMISWESFRIGRGNEEGTGYNTFSDFFNLAAKLVK